MLGKYSLIWKICHKLIWFYRNTVLVYIIFIVTSGEIFGHLGHMGTLTVNKMALPSMYIFGDSVIFLLLLRLMRCHCSFDPQWVKISGHSEQLGPCWSTSHFVNNRHSRVKSQGAYCIGRFWPNWWSEKIWAGNSQKSECLILEVWLILERRWYITYFSTTSHPWDSIFLVNGGPRVSLISVQEKIYFVIMKFQHIFP